ncbi:cysteine-rich venom protein-like [Monodelphis domestica]|uniref:Cysteine-rich venom protein Cau1-like n=1 Tax=Monodelphis domestica TaxID=13616 RepID=F7DWH6_MONDO|nr:cysteine-rich venom protein-like [Monodelphis domestica]
MDLHSALMFLATVIHQSIGLNPRLYGNLSTMKEEIQKKILEHHNNIRRSVIPTASNMLKMEWSHEAATNAQSRANNCTLKVNRFPNRTIGDTVCGENILRSTFPTSWTDAILVWKLQKKNFIYGVGAVNVTGHYLAYTQMIWYRSYKIGCGVAYCPKNEFKYFYVCHYCPAGNKVTSLATPYKKGAKCADCPHACQNGLCTNPCPYEDKYSNCKEMKDMFTCDFTEIKLHCKATCRCTNEIK